MNQKCCSVGSTCSCGLCCKLAIAFLPTHFHVTRLHTKSLGLHMDGNHAYGLCRYSRHTRQYCHWTFSSANILPQWGMLMEVSRQDNTPQQCKYVANTPYDDDALHAWRIGKRLVRCGEQLVFPFHLITSSHVPAILHVCTWVSGTSHCHNANGTTAYSDVVSYQLQRPERRPRPHLYAYLSYNVHFMQISYV